MPISVGLAYTMVLCCFLFLLGKLQSQGVRGGYWISAWALYTSCQDLLRRGAAEAFLLLGKIFRVFCSSALGFCVVCRLPFFVGGVVNSLLDSPYPCSASAAGLECRKSGHTEVVVVVGSILQRNPKEPAKTTALLSLIFSRGFLETACKLNACLV